MRRVLDILGGMLAGAWLTMLLLGSAIDSDTHAYARDGIMLLALILTIIGVVIERKKRVNANG